MKRFLKLLTIAAFFSVFSTSNAFAEETHFTITEDPDTGLPLHSVAQTHTTYGSDRQNDQTRKELIEGMCKEDDRHDALIADGWTFKHAEWHEAYVRAKDGKPTNRYIPLHYHHTRISADTIGTTLVAYLEYIKCVYERSEEETEETEEGDETQEQEEADTNEADQQASVEQIIEDEVSSDLYFEEAFIEDAVGLDSYEVEELILLDELIETYYYEAEISSFQGGLY